MRAPFLLESVDRGDVLVIERGEEPGLPVESRYAFRIVGEQVRVVAGSQR